MKYDIIVQGKRWLVIESDEKLITERICVDVWNDINSGKLVIDKTRPVSIDISPVH
jgi:hypothetical protein